MTESRLLSPEDIAEELGVPLRSAYQYMRDMKPYRIGRHVRVSREYFEAWKLANTVTPEGWVEPEYEGPFVYFIEAAGLGTVKIGWSRKHPVQRLYRLRVGSPVALELLGFMRGDRSMERRLHRRFRHQRARGEWFNLSDELRTFIMQEGHP